VRASAQLPTVPRSERRTERSDRTGKVVWRAYYRDPAGRQRNKTFARKIDAERYLTTVESAKLIGSYIEPALARLTVGEWSERWLEGQSHLKPSTRERYAGILREHVEPKWGAVRLADVSHSAVQAWITSLARSSAPATVRKVHVCFRSSLPSRSRTGGSPVTLLKASTCPAS
jgi:Phage integrase, N-terminal SAM-like domain